MIFSSQSTVSERERLKGEERARLPQRTKNNRKNMIKTAADRVGNILQEADRKGPGTFEAEVPSPEEDRAARALSLIHI